MSKTILPKVVLFAVLLPLFTAGTWAVQQGTKENLEERFYKVFPEGERLFYQGDYEHAKERFHEAFLISEENPAQIPRTDRVASLKMEGICYQYLDELDQALALFRKALRISNGMRPSEDADALNAIAWALYLKGEYGEAMEYLQKAEVTCRRDKECPRSRILIDTGAVYSALGNYSLAFEHLHHGLELLIVEHDGLREAGTMERTRALQFLGNLERSWGNSAKALEYYEEAVRVGRRGSLQPYTRAFQYNPAYLVEALIDLGTLYSQVKQPAKARHAYQEAVDISRGLGARRLIAQSLLNLGNLARDQEELSRAVEYHQQALSLGEEAALRPIIGQASTELGWDSIQMGKPKEAIEFFQRALNEGGNALFPDILTRLYSGLAGAHESLGDMGKALKYYQLTSDSIEKVRLETLSEDRKIGYWQAKQATFERAISLLYRLQLKDPAANYHAEAFAYAERARARALLDMLTEGRVPIRRGLSQEVLQQEQAISQDITRIRKTLLRENLSRAVTAKLELDLSKAEETLGEFRQRLRLSEPAYASLKYPEPLNLKKVQSGVLDGHTLLLEFLLGETQSFLWAVSKTECQMVALPGRKAVEQQVSAYRKLIIHAPTGKESFDRYYFRAQQLYDTLIKPVKNSLSRYKHLVIVPDGILHYLPFETLARRAIKADPAQPRFLIDDYRLSYASSASVLGLVENRRDQSSARDMELLAYADPVLRINSSHHRGAGGNPGRGDSLPVSRAATRRRGNKRQRIFLASVDVARNLYRERGMKLEPLPYSRREVLGIATLYPKNAIDVQLGKAATESSVKQKNLEQFKYLHFATHGLIDEKAPARSGIVLSFLDQEDEDGILEMNEIFNLDLNADLVVLSACQSGLGKLVKGEGLIGLSRAFMYAGASSVVVSLWNVRDYSTAEFMKSFYKHLKAGSGKADALRRAKLDMIHSDIPAHRHPYFWAPFVLIGKD